MSQHRQTLLHSHSKLHGVDEVFKAISFLLCCSWCNFPHCCINVYMLGREHQKQQTQKQLSEHKANNRNNKVNGSTATEAEAALVVVKRPGGQQGSVIHLLANHFFKFDSSQKI